MRSAVVQEIERKKIDGKLRKLKRNIAFRWTAECQEAFEAANHPHQALHPYKQLPSTIEFKNRQANIRDCKFESVKLGLRRLSTTLRWKALSVKPRTRAGHWRKFIIQARGSFISLVE